MVVLILDVILCNGILKHIFARIRPCDANTEIQLLVPRPDDYSFLSGYTATVTALLFAREKQIWKLALVLAVLIAFSRLYLYVHYPTDILGGILVGAVCGYAGMLCVNQILKKKISDTIFLI